MHPRDDGAHARETDGASPVALGAAYVTNFGALASSTPFLALYLFDRGFDAEGTALLLATMPLVRLVATPSWTLLADRLRSSATVLRLVSAGAAATFAVLLFDASRAAVACALILFAAFRAPFGPLIDVLVLRAAARGGPSFGALRAWGTAGYMIGVLATGALVAPFGARALVALTTALLVASWGAALALPRGGGAAAARVSLVGPLAALVRRPRFVLLVASAALHQIGLAPYDALFAAYLTKLGGASLAGIAVALGAGAELAFMIAFGARVRRFGAARVLAIAYAASALRWAIVALVTAPAILAAAQVLHGLGFGAFYLAAVAIVDDESPPAVRASAQGLFAAIAFGVAPSVALAWAGVVTRVAGLRAVFAIAVAASAIAAVVALAIDRARPSRAAATARDEGE